MLKKETAVVWLPLLVAMTVVFAFHTASCERELDSNLEGPMSFRVNIMQGDRGERENPRVFSADPVTYRLNIYAMTEASNVDSGFTRYVHLNAGPTGRICAEQDTSRLKKVGLGWYVQVVNGVAENVPVRVEGLHGRSHIWIEDTGTDEQPGSYSTGLSEPIWSANPTIRNLQETDHPSTNALFGDFVEIDAEARSLVVTGITNDGFYVTDESEVADIYNALYVYSFSRPGDLEEGDVLGQLSGISDEFYGFTELSFPSWHVVGHGAQLPPAVVVTAEMVEDDDLMERYESRFAVVENVFVCPLDEDYEVYGQWKGLIGYDDMPMPGTEEFMAACAKKDGVITVVSSVSAPDFDPSEYAGTPIDAIYGNLRFHVSARWMIYPRDEEDILVNAKSGSLFY